MASFRTGRKIWPLAWAWCTLLSAHGTARPPAPPSAERVVVFSNGTKVGLKGYPAQYNGDTNTWDVGSVGEPLFSPDRKHAVVGENNGLQSKYAATSYVLISDSGAKKDLKYSDNFRLRWNKRSTYIFGESNYRLRTWTLDGRFSSAEIGVLLDRSIGEGRVCTIELVDLDYVFAKYSLPALRVLSKKRIGRFGADPQHPPDFKSCGSAR